MIDLTATSRPENTALSGRKTASGSRGQRSNRYAYRIDPQALNTCRMNCPAAMTTASGVTVYGYRYYDPETGRWLSRDPLGESGHVLISLEFDYSDLDEGDIIAPANLYNFVFNDALNKYDVNGEWFVPVLRVIAAGAGAAVKWWGKRQAKKAAAKAAKERAKRKAQERARERARKKARCEALRQAVGAAKNAIHGVKKCKIGECCEVMAAKAALYRAVQTARKRLNKACPLIDKRGQRNHIEEERKARKIADDCLSYIREGKCKKKADTNNE